jgi:hypothetical protein
MLEVYATGQMMLWDRQGGFARLLTILKALCVVKEFPM